MIIKIKIYSIMTDSSPGPHSTMVCAASEYWSTLWWWIRVWVQVRVYHGSTLDCMPTWNLTKWTPHRCHDRLLAIYHLWNLNGHTKFQCQYKMKAVLLSDIWFLVWGRVLEHVLFTSHKNLLGFGYTIRGLNGTRFLFPHRGVRCSAK